MRPYSFRYVRLAYRVLGLLFVAVHCPNASGQWDDVTEIYLVAATTQASWFGTGMSVADCNLDGLEDLTFANSTGSVVVYEQLPEGGFTLLHELSGSTQPQGVVWFDADGDDDLDLMVARRFAPLALFLRDGDELIESAAEQGIPVDDDWEARGLAVADYDNDGDLDVYVCMYHDGTTGLSENLLLQNDGEGYFTDVTAMAGVGNGIKHTFQGAWFDYDGDGDLDLWVINDREIFPNALYENMGDGTFTDVGPQVGAAQMMFGMTATVGDPDNDGEYELFCTNVENLPNTILDKYGASYASVAPSWGLDGMQYSWGGCWIDVDGDLWSDLMVATYRFPNSLPYDNYYYHNVWQGTYFEDVTEEAWPNEQTQLYCVAACDFNDDLAPDMVGFGNMPYAQMLQNNTSDSEEANGRLAVQLCGTSSNRWAIGAEIRVHAGGEVQLQLVSCGADYMTQQSWKRYFGLGQSAIVDSVVVDWPSGLHEVWYDIAVGSDLRLVEGSSQAALTVLGSACAGDSAWLQFPFEGAHWTMNGLQVDADSVMLTESGTYVAECTWLDGLFSWSDTMEWEILPPHSITVEWTAPDCAGEPGLFGWAADSTLNVQFEGETFPNILAPQAQLAGTVVLHTLHESDGCVESHSFDLPEPDELELYIDYTPPLCHDEPAQAIGIGYGGTPGYLVNWNGADPSNLSDGEVFISLTDDNGCSLDSSFIVDIPEPLGYVVYVVNEDLGGDGSIALELIGGTAPYDILWNNGVMDDTVLTGLTTGLYSWVISDVNGCLLLGLQEIINVDVVEPVRAGWAITFGAEGVRVWMPEGALSQARVEFIDLAGRLHSAFDLSSKDGLFQSWDRLPGHGVIMVTSPEGKMLSSKVY